MSLVLSVLHVWFVIDCHSTQYHPSYYLIRENHTWNTAQSYCQSNCGSNLASVHSTDDFIALQTVINQHQLNGVWIGLNGSNLSASSTTNMNLQWIDGTSIDWGNWGDSLSNNSSIKSMNNTSGCFILSAEGNWYLLPCEGQHYFVCNHCYKEYHYYSPNALQSFDAANDFCLNRCNSTLAILGSYSNHQHTTQYLNAITNSTSYGYRFEIDDTQNVWIGMRTNHSIPQWITAANTTTFGTSPWNVGQPEDGPSPGCVSMQYITTWNWTNTLCSYDYSFLCNHCDSIINKFAVISVEDSGTWSQAKNQCMESLGTTLASVHSESDNTEVVNLCNAVHGTKDCWIGLYYSSSDSSWNWVDDTEVDYTSWYSTNTTTRPINNDLFGCVMLSDAHSFTWYDWNCEQRKSYAICALPSELCNHHQMTTLSGTWTFSDDDDDDDDDCNFLSIEHDLDDAVLILNERQWMNRNGKMSIEYKLKMNWIAYSGSSTSDAHTGIVVHDVDDICNWYYIGMDILKSTVFIDRNLYGSTTRLIEEGISNNTNSDHFEYGTFYTLKVNMDSFEFGKSIYIQLKGDGIDQNISFIDSGLSGSRSAVNSYSVMSGYIGLRSHKVALQAKYLYVSGIAIDVNTTESISSIYAQCPTASPTVNPTISPSFIPTFEPTNIPSIEPTTIPTNKPTQPTLEPSSNPTMRPTILRVLSSTERLQEDEDELEVMHSHNNTETKVLSQSDDDVDDSESGSFLDFMLSGGALIICCLSTFCCVAYCKLKKQNRINSGTGTAIKIKTKPEKYAVIDSKSKSSKSPMSLNVNHLPSPQSESQLIHIPVIPHCSPMSVPSKSLEMNQIGGSHSFIFKATPQFNNFNSDFTIEGDSDHSNSEEQGVRDEEPENSEITINGMEIGDAEMFSQEPLFELDENVTAMNECSVNAAHDIVVETNNLENESEDGDGIEAILRPSEIALSEGDPDTADLVI